MRSFVRGVIQADILGPLPDRKNITIAPNSISSVDKRKIQRQSSERLPRMTIGRKYARTEEKPDVPT